MEICMLGGSGFVGHAIAMQLADAGHRLTVITRRPERHRDLSVLPTVRVVAGEVHNEALLRSQFAGCDAVINLVGILNESGRTTFRQVHAELPAKIVRALQSTGMPRLLHMSALHATAQAPSEYLRTKAAGEAVVLAAESPQCHVTVFRPSVIFGPGDSFTNRFAGLLRFAPLIFPLACAQARFQPVYVEDVATAFVRALDLAATWGRTFNLCGPRVYTLTELVAAIAHWRGLHTRILELPDWAARTQARLLEFAPGKPFTRDNYLSLQVDSVCEAGFPSEFGISPVRLEDEVPKWLKA
jgi:NADH dehydrogenase